MIVEGVNEGFVALMSDIMQDKMTTTTIRTDQEKRRSKVTDFSIDAIMGISNGAETDKQQQTAIGDIGSAMDLTLAYNLANIINSNGIEIAEAEAEEVDVVNVDQTEAINCSSQCKNKRPRPKKYQCPYCWVALSNTGQFRGHIRIHTGERPFKCDHPFCQKTFTRNEELTRHKRIHTGQRPYACSSCNKCFGRKDHLKKHTRTHEKHTQKGSYNGSVLNCNIYAHKQCTFSAFTTQK